MLRSLLAYRVIGVTALVKASATSSPARASRKLCISRCMAAWPLVADRADQPEALVVARQVRDVRDVDLRQHPEVAEVGVVLLEELRELLLLQVSSGAPDILARLQRPDFE